MEHVVAACGEALVKEPGNPAESVLYSTGNYAIGSRGFIASTQERLGSKASGRRVEERNDQCVLREEINPYNTHFAPEKEPLRSKNSYFWDDNAYKTIC